MYHSKNEQRIAEQQLPKTGYVRMADLIKFIPVSKSSIWRMSKAGKFPKGVKLSEKVTAWKAQEVQAWLESKEAV